MNTRTDEPDLGASDRIFRNLVDKADHEVEAYVAFGLFMRDREHWVKSFSHDHARSPTAEELNEYARMWAAGHENHVAVSARSALIGFGMAMVEANEPDLLRRIRHEELGKLAVTIEKSSSLWSSIFSSIVAAAVYTLLLIVVAVILEFSGIDLLSIIESIAAP